MRDREARYRQGHVGASVAASFPKSELNSDVAREERIPAFL
jgi:hypothetical protein